MKNPLTNSLNMVNSTIIYCDGHTAATAGITAFAGVVLVVKGKLVLINGLNQIAGGTSKGVTTDTKLLRKVMTDHALKCANGTLAYANSVNNNTLKALVNFNEKKLNEAKKEDVDDLCQRIHDATDANMANVVNFGIVAQDVTDLQTAIDLYRTSSQNPRNAIITKSQANKQAEAMVRDLVITYLEGQMDVMVKTLKISNKEFYDGYFQAREVIDLGSTSAKVRGTVLDENDVPLKNVQFTIYETGTMTKVAGVFTDTKGKFNAAKLPNGDFDFKWELSGYKTVIETNVHIGPGKELKRKVTMKAGVDVIREYDVPMGGIVNVDLNGIGDSVVKILLEASGSNFRVYGSATAGAAPGATFLDVLNGQNIPKTQSDFISGTGLNAVNPFLNVQNNGAMPGHFKIVFVV